MPAQAGTVISGGWKTWHFQRSEKKQRVAAAALEYLRDGMVLGVGTGSTVNALIDQLAPWKARLRGAVSSSEASSARLRALGIPVLDLNEVADLGLYIDGADEANPGRELIKGGGAALTREKIIAAAARTFVCIVDDSKLVDVLGRFPLPVEVIPMARELVARAARRAGRQAGLARRMSSPTTAIRSSTCMACASREPRALEASDQPARWAW